MIRDIFNIYFISFGFNFKKQIFDFPYKLSVNKLHNVSGVKETTRFQVLILKWCDEDMYIHIPMTNLKLTS